ncbi:uncharacterized protein LOC133137610 [Conger conger]|uniref:uncharacterized protein LOC133137610 n=1 Tax=Conger conger TaxID=82655 RepID=UPI002A5991D2|nr:uncharacterized protein LOC133137610 [Conger conger]
MESLEHSEEPIQDSQHPEPEQAIKACGMVPSLVAPQKHFLDPKWLKAKLAKRTCKLEERRLQVQLPVAVKQEPGIPAVPQHPECTSTHTVTGIENDAFLVCGPSEKPLQTSDLEEFKWDAACKNSAQSPSPSGQPVLLSKDAALEQAPLRETVYRQMTPRAPPQDPRWAVPDRVEIPVGESHFSKFMLSFVTHKPEPLLGLRVVVECRSFKQPTFYLCLTCAEKVSMKHICNHIISDRHRYHYICSKYPDLILDWEDNPTGVAWRVQRHERVSDVQVMKLDLNLYNQVASVPFGAALELLQVSRREQSFLQPFLTPGHRPIILNNWTLPPQKIPETPKQNPDKTGLPKAPIEQAIRHQEFSLHPQQCQTVLGPQQCLTVLGPGQGQTVQTALGPGQDPKLTETDGASPRYSVCMSEKRRLGPGLPQEASRDLEETRRRRVDCRMDTVEHGGAPEERERAAENPDQGEAAEVQAVLAPASPWEPWLNLKGTETDNEKVCRPPLDLQTYIQDPQRTQPLVGLSALVECHSEKQASFFLCMACCILLKTRCIEHVIGPKHRNSYLLKRRPDLFREECTSQDSAKRASYLLEVAKEVEREECGGVGDIQKLSFDSATYTKVKSMPFDKALNLVQTIYKEQKHRDLQTHVSPAAIPVMVKQEKVEHEECSGESIQDPQITGSGQSHDTPQEPVQRQKSSGTEDCPGVENPTGTVAASPQACQSGSGMKTPLIGLQVVIKCVSVDGWPPPIYLCLACSTKLTGNPQSIIKHLNSSQHQYFYIRCRHPNRLEKEKEAGSLTCGMTDLIQFVAKKLEKEEGSGSFQVINLAQNDYERFKLRNYEYCMRTLKSCNGVEARQSCVKPGKGNSDQNAAPRGPGQSPQNSGPQSDASRDGPSTLPPVVSEGHRLAEMRTQERTSVKRRLNCLESPPALATHRPSGHTGRPSLERSLSQPLAPSHPECVLQRASEPWAKTPGAHATTACPRSMSAGKVPQSVSVWGKKCQASLSTQGNPTDDVTTRRLSDFDAPPVKIPRLDYGDLKEERL